MQVICRGRLEALLLLLVTTSVTSFDIAMTKCPGQKVEAYGDCKARIYCQETFEDFKLHPLCLNNNGTELELFLTDGIPNFDPTFDDQFLPYVITFGVHVTWVEPDLRFLHYMPRLRNFYLNSNNIKSLQNYPFYYLTELSYIDLSNNELSDISNSFTFETIPLNLRRLYLKSNKINKLPAKTFQMLINLKELDLSYNDISELNENPLIYLQKLEILNLNNNKIKDLNGALDNLLNLRHLYIQENQLETIGNQSLKVINQLEIFNASSNQLNLLTPNIFMRHTNKILSSQRHSPSIYKILLSSNNIKNLSNINDTDVVLRHSRGLRDWLVYTDLDLCRNSIQDIDYNAFATVVKLNYLDLAYNNLSDFYVNAHHIRHIKHLNLSFNQIHKLEHDLFNNMTLLQNLDVSNNLITYLSPEMFNYNYYLQKVNLTGNQIEVIDYYLNRHLFSYVSGIIDLSNNKIKQMKFYSDEGKHLKELILSGNNITATSQIYINAQSNLQYLDLRKNHMAEIKLSFFLLPKSLLYLDLSENNITKLYSSSFSSTPNLLRLSIAYNQLTNIEFGTFVGLSKLQYLNLSNNKLKYLDSNVLLELISLKELYLSHNELTNIGYIGWYSHGNIINVVLDGNNFDCNTLRTAINDFRSGYTRMKPVSKELIAGYTVEGISCVEPKVAAYTKQMTEEKFLIIGEKILQAINDQTMYLKRKFGDQMERRLLLSL